MPTISSNIESYNSDHSYYALSNATRGYTDSTDTDYASINLTRGRGASTYMYWEFNLPTIPDGSTINSITCNYKARTSTTSTSYITSATIQLCSNKTTKGTSKSILTTTTTTSSFTSTQIGTWTVAEINAGVKLKTSATRGTSRTTSNYYIYFYGADIEITYTEPVTGNKIYIKSYGEWKEANNVLVKVNGNWSNVADAYKKVSGSWVKQQDKSAMFDNAVIFIQGKAYVDGALVMGLDGISSYANRYSDEYLSIDGMDDVYMHQEDVLCDGMSFELNGTSSYLRPSSSSIFDDFDYNTHTIEVYFEPYSFDTDNEYRTTFYVGRSSNNIALYFYVKDGEYSFIHSSTVATRLPQIDNPPTLNQKHYVAVNADGFMFDGIYTSSSNFSTSTGSLAVNNEAVVSGQYTCASIGRRFRTSGDPQYFHGKIYAVRIHNALLTEDDMRNNMECDIIRFNN